MTIRKRPADLSYRNIDAIPTGRDLRARFTLRDMVVDLAGRIMVAANLYMSSSDTGNERLINGAMMNQVEIN